MAVVDLSPRVFGPGVSPVPPVPEVTTAERIQDLVTRRLYPQFQTEEERVEKIDRWYRWNHTKPTMPTQATQEYRDLSDRSLAPWGHLIVTAIAQALYVEDYRSPDSAEPAASWAWWQANGMDGRQIAIHRAALAYGLAYVSVLPGTDEFGAKMPVIRGHSPKRMMAFYREPAFDNYPEYALQVDPVYGGGSTPTSYRLKVYDATSVHSLTMDSQGSGIAYTGFRDHKVGFCPVIRYADDLDLEGRSPGQIEPHIAILGRIDQTTFDRLVVQRFGSWITRWVTGMAPPDNPEDEARVKMLLTVADILIGESEGTKFGALPATPLDGFIEAGNADIRHLAAVTQTPAHELLGSMANMSADAIVAAREGKNAKVLQRQHSFGESHEQTLRVAAHVMGDEEGARDTAAEVHWRDTEPRSLAQVADALVKLEQMGVPFELLVGRVPGFTGQDVKRAMEIRAAEPPAPVNPPPPMPPPAG